MRILLCTPGLHCEGHKNSQSTGFAIIVEQISSILARDNELYISNSCFYNDTILKNNYTIVKRRLWQVVKNARFGDIVNGVKYSLSSQGISLRGRLFIIKYFACCGYVDSVISEIKPDIIHIHGLLLADIPFIKSAVRSGAKFMITLHGLYSLSDSVTLSKFEKSFEFKMLKLLLDAENVVSVVSSGMKQRILKRLLSDNIDPLKVVFNSFPATCCKSKSVRKKQIVFAGNLMERKNQAQLIRAIALVDDKTRDGLKVVFVGADYLNGELQNLARELKVEDVCEFGGSVSREAVFEILSESFCTCLLSIDEGFGLSMMEGYHFGLPTICFNDIDAVADIYDPQCSVVLTDREDVSVARAIEKMFVHDWDREYIKLFSQKFSQEIMSENYMNLYNSLEHTSVTESKLNSFFDKYFKWTN